MTDNALMNDESLLQGLFPICQFGLQLHRCSRTNRVASCCAASKAVLDSVASANSTCGVNGILLYLQSKCSRGIRRCEYLCDAVEHGPEVDCSARTAVALELLHTHLSSYHDSSRVFAEGDCLCVAHVEVIIRQNASGTTLFRNDFDKMTAKCHSMVQLECLQDWVGTSCSYQHCVGLYSDVQRHLRVWDFGEWLMYRSCLSCDPGSVVAIRVTPFRGDDHNMCSSCPIRAGYVHSADQSIPILTGVKDSKEWFLWDGELRLLAGTWIRIGATCSAVKTEPDSCQMFHQHSVGHLPPSIARQRDTLNRIYMRPSATPPCASDPVVQVAVFISGCHMSPNPGPGVGIARAIRAAKNKYPGFPYVPSCESGGEDKCFIPHASGSTTGLSPSRTAPTELSLIAVDDMGADTFSGGTDPVFDSCRLIALHHSPTEYLSCKEHESVSPFADTDGVKHCKENVRFCAALVDMLCPMEASSMPQGFTEAEWRYFIPGCSKDAVILGSFMTQVRECMKPPDDGVNNLMMTDRYKRACAKILSPSLEALKLTLRPQIPGAVGMGCFRVPPFLTLSDHGVIEVTDEVISATGLSASSGRESNFLNEYGDSCSGNCHCDLKDFRELQCWSDTMTAIHAFCEKVGYPVLLKGPSLCDLHFNWHQVSATVSSWAVARNESGDSTSAGCLPTDIKMNTGYLMVQKHVVGAEKSIAFAAIDGELTGAIAMTKYVCTTAGKVWVGAMCPVEDGVLRGLERFVGESGWTGGGDIKFIETEENEWFVIDFKPHLPAWSMATCYSGCNLAADLLAHAVFKHSGATNAFFRSGDYSRACGQFARSVVELPVFHYAIHRQGYKSITPGFSSSSQCSGRGVGNMSYSRSLRRLSNKPSAGAGDCDFDAPQRELGESPVGAVEESLPSVASLSSGVVIVSDYVPEWLSTLCRAASVVADDALAQESVSTPRYILCGNSVKDSLLAHKAFVSEARELAGLAKSLNLSLCVAVRTQPHREVLKLALELGYMAECISMAEVRSALDVGFSMHSIVLTGPGKFWSGVTLPPVQSPLTLRAIFADSLADLRTIVSRVCDCSDWLSASIVGIRFMPVCGPRTRFGLDGSDPCVLLAAAQLIQLLPADISIGIQFHCASYESETGLPLWRGLVKGAATLARHFGEICQRPIKVLDVGGGWSSSFLQQPHAKQDISSMLRHIYCEFIAASATPAAVPLTIQFEPGKALVEIAGALLCRVLCIREIPCDISLIPADISATIDSCRWVSVDGKGETLSSVRRAVIVDLCVSDVSSSNLHPIMWRAATQSISPQDDVVDTSSSSATPMNWVSLCPGLDQIWGRSCMEFDILNETTSVMGVTLPQQIQEGDFILIAATGAYDMSRQCAFADEKGRECCFVNLK